MNNQQRLTPEGTRDVLFQQAQSEYEVADHLRAYYQQYGYREVRTPGIEFYDVFTAGHQYFPQESMYKSTDRHGKLVVMRPDSTIPIARLVSSKLKHRPMPLRLYYDQMVYRAGQGLDGFSHEMRQSGIELIGDNSFKSDVEMLALSCDTLRTLGFDDFRIEIGHVGIVENILAQIPLVSEDKDRIRAALDEKNFFNLQDILEPMKDEPAAKLLLMLPRLFGGVEIFERARELFCEVAPKTLTVLDELSGCYDRVKGLCEERHIMVDLSLANQAYYYTGLIFRGYVSGVGATVLSGGRYDRLLDDFGLNIPAIGCGVRVDLLARMLSGDYDSSQVPFELLYADLNELGEALKWRRSRPQRMILALSDNEESAFAEASRLGADALVIYRQGQIVRKECADA